MPCEATAGGRGGRSPPGRDTESSFVLTLHPGRAACTAPVPKQRNGPRPASQRPALASARPRARRQGRSCAEWTAPALRPRAGTGTHHERGCGPKGPEATSSGTCCCAGAGRPEEERQRRLGPGHLCHGGRECRRQGAGRGQTGGAGTGTHSTQLTSVRSPARGAVGRACLMGAEGL